MRQLKYAVIAFVLATGCSSAPTPAGGGEDATGGNPAGKGGTGGSKPGTGGAGVTNSGGSPGASGGSGSGGAPGAGGADASGPSGTGGDSNPPGDAATGDDVASPTDSGTVTPPSDAGPIVTPGDPTQGPTAEGTIKFSTNFEGAGFDGMSLSPTNLPASRVNLVADPTGKRGKVVSIDWLAGDNFRTSAGTEPRSWFSAAKVYQITPGTKVSIAWGEMWTTVNMNAFFAQVIGPGPVFEMRVREDGTFNTLCNQCGGNVDHFKFEPNRWYDFKVNMDWTSGGAVRFFVDGKMVREAKLGGVAANSHWDGGIYWAKGSTKGTRKIYLSNLSIGER